MIIYDADLKAEYLKGDFKNPLRNMSEVSIKDFTNVDHLAADVIDASVEYGPEFKILVTKDLKDKVNITKQGHTLVIKYTGDTKRSYNYYSPGVTIVCPRLDSITTTTNYESLTDFKNAEIVGDVDIIGFNQQKMVVKANRLTEVEMKNNKIDALQAVVGDNSMGVGSLNIAATNHFKLANIKVNGVSELTLNNADITTLEHTFSDNASLTFTGSATRLFK